MKRFILVIGILSMFGCAPSISPKVTWYVDPWKSTWQQYQLDKEQCRRYAESSFPKGIGVSAITQPHMRNAYYIDCMSKCGHRIYCNKSE